MAAKHNNPTEQQIEPELTNGRRMMLEKMTMIMMTKRWLEVELMTIFGKDKNYDDNDDSGMKTKRMLSWSKAPQPAVLQFELPPCYIQSRRGSSGP